MGLEAIRMGGPIKAKSVEPQEKNPRTLGSGVWRAVPRRKGRRGGPPKGKALGAPRTPGLWENPEWEGRDGHHSARHPTPSSLLQDPPPLSHRTRSLAVSVGGNALPGHRRSPAETGPTRAPATCVVALTRLPKTRQRRVMERMGAAGEHRAALRAAGRAPLVSCLSKRSHKGSVSDMVLGANAQSASQLHGQERRAF